MPDKRTFKVGEEVFDIPNEKVGAFKAQYPGAVELSSFIVEKDTFDIPIEKTKAFLDKYPNAVPTFDSQKKNQIVNEGQPSGNIGSLASSRSGLQSNITNRQPVVVEQTPVSSIEKMPPIEGGDKYTWATSDAKQITPLSTAGFKSNEQVLSEAIDENKIAVDNIVNNLQLETDNPVLDYVNTTYDTLPNYLMQQGVYESVANQKTQELKEKTRAKIPEYIIPQYIKKVKAYYPNLSDKEIFDGLSRTVIDNQINKLPENYKEIAQLNVELQDLYAKAKDEKFVGLGDMLSFGGQMGTPIRRKIKEVEKKIDELQKKEEFTKVYDPMTGEVIEDKGIVKNFETLSNDFRKDYEEKLKHPNQMMQAYLEELAINDGLKKEFDNQMLKNPKLGLEVAVDDEAKLFQEKMEDELWKSEAKLSALTKMALLNGIDLSKGLVYYTDVAKRSFLQSLGIPQWVAPDLNPVMLEEAEKIYNEHGLTPPKEVAEKLEKNLTEHIISTGAGIVPVIGQMWIGNKLLGATGLVNMIKNVSKTKPILGFMMNMVKEEMLFQGILGGKAGVGSGFYAGSHAFNTLFNKLTPGNPFIKGLATVVGSGLGGTFGAATGEIGKGVYNELTGKDTFKQAIDEYYGNYSDFSKRIISELVVFSLMGLGGGKKVYDHETNVNRERKLSEFNKPENLEKVAQEAQDNGDFAMAQELRDIIKNQQEQAYNEKLELEKAKLQKENFARVEKGEQPLTREQIEQQAKENVKTQEPTKGIEEKPAELTLEQKLEQRLSQPKKEEVKDDSKDITGVSGEVGIGEKPVETKPVAETGEEKISDDRVVQEEATPELDVTIEKISKAVEGKDISPDVIEEAAALVQEGLAGEQDVFDAIEKAKSEPELKAELDNIEAEVDSDIPQSEVKQTEPPKTEKLPIGGSKKIEQPTGQVEVQKPAEQAPVEVKQETKAETKQGITDEKVNEKYIEKPIKEINTDESRFQNRTELDQEHVKRIAGNWNENQLDPVVIWKDANGRTYLLAGHHRLAAAKLIGKKTIASKYFEGSEKEAIEYAKGISNANRLVEENYERAKYYRNIREKGASNKDIKDALEKEGKNKVKIENMSYLNPKGKVMNMLESLKKSTDAQTQKTTETIADWIGEARRRFDIFTDAHEEEMYDYLVKDNGVNKIRTKTEFIQRMQNVADVVKLMPNEQLNLGERKTYGTLENEKRLQINAVDKQIKDLEKERKNPKGALTEQRLKEITNEINIKNKELLKLKKELFDAKEGDKQQIDIFSQINTEVENGNIKQESINGFENRTADEIRKSEPVIKAIESETKDIKGVKSTELQEKLNKIDNLIETVEPIFGDAKEQSVKDKAINDIQKGIDGIMNKIGGKKNLLPEERTSLVEDFRKIISGVTDLTVEELREFIRKSVLKFKEKFKWSDKDVDDFVNEVVPEKQEVKTEKPELVEKEEKEPETITEQINPVDVEGVAKEVENAFEKQKKEIASKKVGLWERIKRGTVKRLFDVMGVAKKSLIKSGFAEAVRRKELEAGASAAAKSQIQEYNDKIFKGLSKQQVDLLNKIIEARRDISIDTRFDAQGKPRPKHKSGLTKEKYEIYLSQLEQKNPKLFEKINKRADAFFDAYKDLLKKKLDEGRISQEVYDALINNEYSPRKTLEHLMEQETMGKGSIESSSGRFDIKNIEEGSEGAYFNDAKWLLETSTLQTYRTNMRNKTNRALYEFAEKQPDNGIVEIQEPIGVNKVTGQPSFPEPRTGWTQIQYFDNGVKKSMIMQNEIAKDWESDNPVRKYMVPNVVRVLSGGSVLRSMATGINPVFALSNLPKDFLHIIFATDVYSKFLPKAMLQLGKDYGAVLKDVFMRKGRYKEYLEEGGGMDFLTHQGKVLESGVVGRSKTQEGIDAAEHIIGYINETSELIGRVAIREREIQNNIKRFVKENGRQPNAKEMKAIKEMATYEARAQMDFSKGGDLTKFVDQVIPYTNAGFVGFNAFVRAAKKNPKAFSAKIAQIGSVAIALFLYNDEYEEYKDIPKEVKERNFVIMLPFTKQNKKGQEVRPYISIPKALELSIVTRTFENVASLFKKGEVEEDVTLEAIKTSIPTINPLDVPALNAAWTYIANYDRFRDQKVWKGREVLPEDEYTKNTGEFYKAIGKELGVSPTRLEAATGKIFTDTKYNIYSLMIGKAYNSLRESMNSDIERKELDKSFGEHLSDIFSPFKNKYLRESNPDYTKYKEEEKQRIEELKQKKTSSGRPEKTGRTNKGGSTSRQEKTGRKQK